jgi:uncharacterized protein (AIM24 family)
VFGQYFKDIILAGKLIVDTIDTDNAFITLNVQQSLIATMNVSGIFSNTGVKMIGANGTVSNTAITGLVTAAQIATVANTQITGNITSSQITSNPTFYGNVSVTGTSTLTGNVSIANELSFNSGYGSAAKAYGCRAWVNFNGTGTVAIRASGNVSSITDNGTGDYTVNFTTALVDIDYSFVVACSTTGGNESTGFAFIYRRSGTTTTPTTTAARVFTANDAGSLIDPPYVCASIFR